MNAAWSAIPVLAFLSGCSHPKPEAAKTEDKRESDLVEMSVEAQKHVALKVEPVHMRQMNEYLQVPGTVQATDSRVHIVRPLARGRLYDVLVRVGDRVQAGQTLARYDNIEAGELTTQLASAKAELQKLLVQERNLERQAERARSLAEIGAVPQKDFEQARADLQAAQESIKAQESVVAGLVARLSRYGLAESRSPGAALTTLSSPLNGVVTKLAASPGEVVEASSELFTIADLSTVWVQAEVYEKDIGRLRVGQPALITVETYPNEQFTGTVTYVSDFLDPQTRTAKVRCEVPNGSMRLKLDMFANVNLPTTFSRRTLAVPAGAVQQVGDKTVVFIQKALTKFEPRSVSGGNTVKNLVEITNGLTEGEPVVTAGAFHLKSILVGKDLGEE
jgi:cobalt-zinc-cadmium efflux system membrane fusion protein